MEITCAQMDVLLSFYIEGDLSKALKIKVEEHLKNCSSCRAKYNIVKGMLDDLKSSIDDKEEICSANSNSQYRIFQNNKKARKELEDTYNIRRLMSESFNKTKMDARQDFSRNVIRQLNPNEEYNFSFHPVIKLAIAFVMTVLVLSAIIVFSLTFS